MTRYIGFVDIRAAGIPAKAGIVSYHPGRPGKYTGHPDDRYPEDPPEVEFDICDQRGRFAQWLEEKISTEELRRIESAVLVTIERQRHEGGEP